MKDEAVLFFIIPAHNEEQHLGQTIAAITAIGNTCGEPLEIIVVDDASTDRTADIATAAGVESGLSSQSPSW